MDRLENLFIFSTGSTKYDFAHTPIKYVADFNKTISKALSKDDDQPELLGGDPYKGNEILIQTNVRYITDKLGLNDLIYRLTVAKDNAKTSTVLEEKLNRATAISELIANFVLLLIHNLYWIKLNTYRKSTLPLSRAYNFAIDIGKDLVDKFEKRLNEEYNISNILEAEFGKKDPKKIVK